MGCIETLVKGALLHDVGKVVYRASEGSGDHSTAGATFLRSYTEEKELIRCVQYHHGRKLSSAVIPDNSLAYLVYEADNLASALDRREYDEGEGIAGQTFDKNMPLTSVFHTFGGTLSKVEKNIIFEVLSYPMIIITQKKVVFKLRLINIKSYMLHYNITLRCKV